MTEMDLTARLVAALADSGPVTWTVAAAVLGYVDRRLRPLLVGAREDYQARTAQRKESAAATNRLAAAVEGLTRRGPGQSGAHQAATAPARSNGEAA